MIKVRHLAVTGVILVGGLGCTAEAQTAGATPTIALTPGQPSPSVTLPRQDIRVTVEPSKVEGGSTRSVHITAFCPLPQGGTDYRATARSEAFTGLVTLVAPTSTPSPDGTPGVPLVRGGANVRADAKPGGYKVEVRCEATNDIGGASLKVTPGSAPRHTPTKIPTRAPHAGGGGTAAGAPEEDSGLPVGATSVALLAAVGVAIGVARRRAGR
ncbi:hypothetical protein [Microtetraspora sp. NBRC 16547]|uniref:hypothetical protein n=1 Tax=Microtetraspora sp. NBRC 16547 TaxID=3030993 RepID=UPI0024A2D08D|nr:hypothetical protein [Microtetraspora sp. NBRC 16547]GLW96275.1 hypothetical protein Misp02_03620 [Microtetraspora sp. NBRC 16547]